MCFDKERSLCSAYKGDGWVPWLHFFHWQPGDEADSKGGMREKERGGAGHVDMKLGVPVFSVPPTNDLIH